MNNISGIIQLSFFKCRLCVRRKVTRTEKNGTTTVFLKEIK